MKMIVFETEVDSGLAGFAPSPKISVAITLVQPKYNFMSFAKIQQIYMDMEVKQINSLNFGKIAGLNHQKLGCEF